MACSHYHPLSRRTVYSVRTRHPRCTLASLGLARLCSRSLQLNILLWPLLAIILERALYGLPSTHGSNPGLFSRFFRRANSGSAHLNPRSAIHVSHLRKSFDSKRFFFFGKRKSVLAIEDLSFDVPRGEIFCLLGRNGAAKSTTLSIIAGLTSRTSGDVAYAPDLRIGIAGQKDVLWDDLDCEQHAAVWRAIKGLDGRKAAEEDKDLLARCDLTPKLKCLSQNLSGGQKRKLQLACALAGGSNLLLLDEISSGLDPLSRRAIWKVLADVRGRGLGYSDGASEPATVVLTTHFLDEADYLGDEIAILKAPGRLLAVDSPVGLKTRQGRGFVLAVQNSGEPGADARALAVLDKLRAVQPGISMHSVRGQHLFSTGTNHVGKARELARILQGIRHRDPSFHYTVGSTTLEDVFIDLNHRAGDKFGAAGDDGDLESPFSGMGRDVSGPPSTLAESKGGDIEMQISRGGKAALYLTPGEKRAWWRSGAEMAATVLHKRFLVFRRSWFIPLAAIIGITLGATVPLVFMKGRSPSCTPVVKTEEGLRALSFPYSPFASTPALWSSGGVDIGNWTNGLNLNVVDGTSAFTQTLDDNIHSLTFGGVALAPLPGADSIVAYEGDPDDHILQVKGLSALNLYSNAVYQQLQPSDTQFRIQVSYEVLPFPDFAPTGKVLLWITFFGMVMAIWPAFAAIYPSTEKRSGVRINQYSNGARPAALWAGHLLFELPWIVLVSTIVVIACAAVNQFTGLGQLWVCLILYGISATCYAYLISLFLKTSFGAWAAVASINGVIFLFYVVVYSVIQTVDKTDAADEHMTIAHLAFAVLHPVVSLVRAAFVAVNLFNLLCDGRGGRTTKDLSDMTLFGAPVTYMIVQGLLAFALLVWVDSGRPLPHWLRRSGKVQGADPVRGDDVNAEKARVEGSGCADALVVRRLTKQFPKTTKPSVDDVSFGVAQGDTFALIGPNGAGKTTTLGVVRGVTEPTKGDVSVTERSIVRDRNLA